MKFWIYAINSFFCFTKEGKEFLKKSWGDDKLERVEKHLASRDESAAEEKPVEEKTVEEKPTEDKAAEDKPAEDKPVEEDKAVEAAAVEDSVVPTETVSDEVEESPKKKAKLSKNMTMAATAEVFDLN